MPSSPWPPTAGAPPPGAAPAVVYTPSREHNPVKDVGCVRTIAQEARSRLPWDENSEEKALKHEEKTNKYQAVLAARLKDKYFSRKAFEKDVFEEITIQSETIRLSRRAFTTVFADPAKFCQGKGFTEKNMRPSLTSASST